MSIQHHFLLDPCRQETSVELRTKGMLSMRPRFGGTGSNTPSLPCRLRPKPTRIMRSPLRLRTVRAGSSWIDGEVAKMPGPGSTFWLRRQMRQGPQVLALRPGTG